MVHACRENQKMSLKCQSQTRHELHSPAPYKNGAHKEALRNTKIHWEGLGKLLTFKLN
jgi:hypothetical protein